MIKNYKLKYFALIGIITFSIVVYVIMPRGKAVILNEPDELFDIINDGDIICRLGDRFWSQVFKNTSITDKRFSHLGIIRINNDNVTVIHAEGTIGAGRDFVKEQSLEDFLGIARAIGIYRTKNINGFQISNKAVDYLGIPFDWKFDMNDVSEIYCTELLYIILKELLPEIELGTTYIKELGRDIIPLEAISNSEYFSEIYFN